MNGVIRKERFFAGLCVALLVFGTAFVLPVSASEFKQDPFENDSLAAVPVTRHATAHQAVLPPTTPQQLVVAERVDTAIDLISKHGAVQQELEIYEPGASFIKLHFSHFNLPKGVTIELSNPLGSEIYRYSRYRSDAFTFDRRQGDDGKNRFSAMSVAGDTVIVRVLGLDSSRPGAPGKLNALGHRVQIDYVMVGLPEGQLEGREAAASTVQKLTRAADGSGISKPESTCGINERYDVACWQSSHPQAAERARPVAKLLVGGSKACTAWRVGQDNRVFTNNHCIASQDEANSAELWFNYQATQCGSSSLEPITKVTVNTLLTADWALDYSLFTVNNFTSIAEFGHLGLEVREGLLGETIYIPQHGSGRQKQIAVESDMNVGGLCQIDSESEDGYAPGTDIGYFCDTAGGSSGSPVLTTSDHRVIALHHLGGCYNSGVRMSQIWPGVSGFFGGVVPGGSDDAPNQPPQPDFTYSCSGLSCSFDGGASGDPDGSVVSWSWSFGDGGQASGALAAHTFPASGSYSVSLEVADNEGAAAQQTQLVTVSAANQAPTAGFTLECAALSCTFDAGLSSDADGVIVDYQWYFGDGASQAGTSAVATHQYSASGNYSVILLIEDDDGATNNASSTINVLAANQAPTAAFNVNCQDLDCTLDATGSQDSDGQIVSYHWDFGDGQTQQGQLVTVTHAFASAGNYNVVLTVTDDVGAQGSHLQAVSVSTAPPPNQPPQADFTFTCSGLSCDFDGSLSSDPDGTVTSYQWNFGDGSTATGVLASHTFVQSGEYQVTLSIADNSEASHNKTLTVEVVAVTNPGLVLSVATGKYRGDKFAELGWSGATTQTVVILRDGAALQTTANTGSYTDNTVDKRVKTASYQVCETGLQVCSAVIDAKF